MMCRKKLSFAKRRKKIKKGIKYEQIRQRLFRTS